MVVVTQRDSLPILRAADVLVVGGSFAGCAAAIGLAWRGYRVVLVEPRTYLGREVTATLRPWIEVGAFEEELPEPLRQTVPDFAPLCGSEYALKLDAVKVSLEDALLSAGVEIIYASLPTEVLRVGHALSGVVIGNKSGRQVITCSQIIDSTETALVARLAGATFEPMDGRQAIFSRTLEFTGARPIEESELSVPASFGIHGNRVVVHRGYRGPDHLLIECPLQFPIDGFDLAATMKREIEARHRTLRLASWLINNLLTFADASLAAASYELSGPQTPRLEASRIVWATPFDATAAEALSVSPISARLSDFAGPLKGLWCLSEAARLPQEQCYRLINPITSWRIGTAFANAIPLLWAASTQARGTVDAGEFEEAAPKVEASQDDQTIASPLIVREPASPQRGRLYKECHVHRSVIPVLHEVDVLVVGGGTSGATAAMTAAREGTRTVLVELNPGLGGTATLGGVDSYWFGRKVGFANRVAQVVDEIHESLRHRLKVWNVEGKMYGLLREAEQAGVEVNFNAITIGTVVEGNRVRGAVVATRFGVFVILASVVIDATGDGDLAAFAGAEYVYGSARDHLAMWYSIAQFARPGRSRNNFTSTVDVSNVEDYTRAILAGRRRGENCHDHGIYVASRETRHILADVVLTLTDQLLQRAWPDVVNVHFSNHDVKGVSGADWVNLGLIPPNLEVEIPYRALLPRGLEGILVVGKAFSATHDALPAIRMQADLENLGGVAGLAASLAVQDRCTPRAISINELQRRLVDAGVLPREILDRRLTARVYANEDLETLVESLTADHPLYDYSDMDMNEVYRGAIPFAEVCTAGPRIVPILERAIETARGQRQVLIAQALATYQSPSATPVLIDEIERQLADGKLPSRTSRIRHANLPPDQGAMPDAAYLLYSLGIACDHRSVPVWHRVADLLEASEEDIRDRFKGVFYYVHAVCSGAERLGDPAAIPILEQIHSHLTLQNQHTRSRFQPDFFQERQAFLELTIGRAMARCGSAAGYRVLIAYLDDTRALLAEHAHTELREITNEDFGKDAGAWSSWLATPNSEFQPVPMRERLDWYQHDELILRSASYDFQSAVVTSFTATLRA